MYLAQRTTPATGVRSSIERAPGIRSTAPTARRLPPAWADETWSPIPSEPWPISPRRSG